MNEEEKKVSKLFDLQNDIDHMEEQLARAREQIKSMAADVDQMIRQAAAQHLVDDAGQPVNGALYWYRHQAIVQVGTMVYLVPCKTMHGHEVFAPPSLELPAEVETEAEIF